MKNWRLKLSLIINYIIFAILLNSVGVVILQVINDFGVNPESASVLEAWKDLSIAVASFLLASYIPRFGYKRAMITGLSVVILGSIMMPLFGGFAMSQLLFAMVGVSFALIKISVYSTVSLVTDNANEHASFMSTLEGFFMIGVLSGFWLFGFFIDLANNNDSFTWLDTYWVLAGIGVLALLLLLSTDLDESSIKTETDNPLQDFKDMIGLIKYSVVIFFILGAFIYVYIEQALNTWLPTFNYQVLQLPDAISVQISSIYAGALAAGRILGGYIMKKLNWFYVLQACLIMASVLVLLVLPLTIGIEPGSITGWAEVPIAAYVLPAIGLFLAPIYPTLSSSIL
ncbi:MAG: MFS transporter, partial [Balneolaceae bacterium]|nr:MFS transporter [Balneolaceae bacterium]